MTKPLIIVITVLSLIAGAWFHGNSHGKATMEAQYIEAENELRSELAELRRESLAIQREKEQQIANQRRQADERIAELESANAELRQYMETRVPDDALDYAFGVRDPGTE